MNKRNQAVRMIEEGRLIKDVATELNISSRQVYNWLKAKPGRMPEAGEDDGYLDINYTFALAS